MLNAVLLVRAELDVRCGKCGHPFVILRVEVEERGTNRVLVDSKHKCEIKEKLTLAKR